jgi:hypothetical protein
MVNSTQTRVAVGIAAVVWFAIAFFSGDHHGQWTALKAFSTGGSLATLALLAYDRWIWAWPLVRRLTGKPNLNGTWRGELHSDFLRDGKKIDPIPTAIRVKQTNSQLYVTLFTGESFSVTEMSELVKEADERWRLSFVYTNKPRAEVRSRSDQHQGVCELYITGLDDSLTGNYFTGRKTTGEMKFTDWSKARYGDAVTALAASDFTKPKPFANRYSTAWLIAQKNGPNSLPRKKSRSGRRIKA